MNMSGEAIFKVGLKDLCLALEKFCKVCPPPPPPHKGRGATGFQLRGSMRTQRKERLVTEKWPPLIRRELGRKPENNMSQYNSTHCTIYVVMDVPIKLMH